MPSLLKNRPTLLLLLSAGFFVAPLPAADWPNLLGPNHDGTSPETGLAEVIPDDGLPRLWEKDLGTGYGPVAVREDTLIVFHRIANEEVIEAISATTGKTLWTQRYPTRFRDPYGYNNGPRGSAVLSENRCFTFGAEGVLSCVDLATGELIWRVETAKRWNVPEAFFGVGSSPLLEGDRVIVIVGGQPESGVVAFEQADGAVAWESVGRSTWDGQPKTGWRGEPPMRWNEFEKQAGYATPVAATLDGRRVLFCFMRQGLVLLDAAEGRVLDQFWFRATVDESVNAMNPVVIGNRVLLSAAYYRVGSVLLEVDTETWKLSEVWRERSLEVHWTTPLVIAGNVYAFSGRNEPDASFRCVEFATGKLLWERDESAAFRSRRPDDKFMRGSAILADGRIYALGESGLLGVFKPDPTAPVELSRWKVPDLEHPCWAPPTLSNGRLFIRSEKRLVCLDLRRPAQP